MPVCKIDAGVSRLPTYICSTRLINSCIGSGIGRETAFTFAEKGSQGIIFADINEESAKASVEESKKFASHPEYRAISYAVDVADREKVRMLMQFAAREFGRLDFCCNCAGVSRR